MGGGASKAKSSAKKQISQANAFLLEGDLERAIDICLFMTKTKVAGLSEKDSISTAKEISKIEDEVYRLQKILEIASTEAEVHQNEGEKLLQDKSLEAAKQKFEEAAGRYQKALIFECGSRGEAWAVAHAKKIARPKLFKHHGDSLTVKGKKVICKDGENAGSAIVNEEASNGILIAEFRIAQCKAEGSDIFFGVLKANEVEADDYWYDESFADKAWFLSNDGDLCNGEEALEGVDSQWQLQTGDSIKMQLQFPHRTDPLDTAEGGGQLAFWKNGRPIPHRLTGIRGPVLPAVCMSDCAAEDCVEVIDVAFFPSEADSEGNEPKPKTLTVLKRVQAAFIMCQATAMYIDFQIPSVKIQLSACKQKMREAIAAWEQAGDSKPMVLLCRSRQMDLFGKLKDEVLGMADSELKAADELVEAGKLTHSFQVYDNAIRLLSKAEEPGLLKHAQKQRQAAVSRRDVSARTADRNMKIVRSKIKAIDVSILPDGYEDCIEMATESAELFMQAGDAVRSQDAEQWIEICKSMQSASEACASGNEAMERGKETGAAYHYQKANNFYSESATILAGLGNPMFSAEMKKQAYFALEALDLLKEDEGVDRQGTAAEQMKGAMQDYADALDGKEDEEEAEAGRVDPILTGDLSMLLPPRTNTFSVYVSSSFSEHSAERACLAEMVSVAVRDAVNRFGYEFEIIDPQLALPARKEIDHDFEFQDKCSYLIKHCARESMGVDFLCMVGQDDNGMAFPGHIHFDMFNRVIKGIPDRGEQSKIRKVILDWFQLDTNSNPRQYVMADKTKKIPQLKSADKRKRDMGWQEWVRVYGMMHRGFYEACVKDIENKQQQQIRMGIMGKIGDLDSYGMKKKVQDLFNEIDQDGSGEVDKLELKEAFEKLDVFLTVEQVEEYMADFDDDGSGHIEFEEFLLMVERIFKDAKENLKNADSAMDTSHTKYFMQSLLWQEVCDGMLDRPAKDVSARTVAVLWGFDPSMPGREMHTAGQEDDSDAIAALRAQHLKEHGKAERVEDQLELKRPEWMRAEPAWRLKHEIFKTHCAGVAERAAQDNEAAQQVSSRTATPQVESIVLDGEDGQPGDEVDPDVGGEGASNTVEEEDEAEGFARAEVVEILLMRKTPVLRILPRRAVEKLAMQGTILELGAIPGQSEVFVKQREGEWDLTAVKAAREKIGELEEKIAKLEDRKRTVRNAVDKKALETQAREMQIDVRALKADLDQSMYILLEGEMSVWDMNHKGQPKKLAALTIGDGFGDLTFALGRVRDSTVMIDSISCTVLELAKEKVQTVVFRSNRTERRLKEVVAWRNEESLRTHYLTYAIPEVDSHMRQKVLGAMRNFRSPLFAQLLPEEVNVLARRCCLLQLDTDISLFEQDDDTEAGWSQFGSSAFVLLSGELHVSITVENEMGEREELEVLRLLDNGDTVGELSLVAELARSCTVRTRGKCLIAELTSHVFHEEVARDGVAEGLFESMSDRESAGVIVEAQVLNARVLHALKLRRSNMLKLLSDIEIEFLAAVSTIHERKGGEVVVTQGSNGDSMFVVVRGEVKLMVAFADGEEQREIARLLPGDSVGEMALILGQPYASSVQITSTTCLLAEVAGAQAGNLFEARSDIVEVLEAMAYGDSGGVDVLRARTPIGGRAATPGGVVAQGLKSSQAVVTFPWFPKKKAMHVELQGGRKYLASFSHMVSNALLGSIDAALHKHHQERMVENREIIEEAAFHAQMAAELTRTFAGREEELQRLVGYIDGEYNARMGLRNQPTIVLAEPGVGKSTLLAKAGVIAKTRFPGSVMVFKFIGWSERTLNSTKMLHSIIQQLCCTLGLRCENLPHTGEELRLRLEELLANAAKGELISLILDAVDELETPQGFDPNFDWLPRLLPKFSSITLSMKSTSPAVASQLNQIFTGEVFFRIYALHPSNAMKVLENKLTVEGRTGFQNDQFESVRTASLASAGLEGTPLNCSPIFLSMAMHIADSWVSFEPARQLPKTLPELVTYALEHMENEHGRMLVERASGYLMMSRDGLSRPELMDLLSCDDDVVEDVFGVQVPDYRRIPGSVGMLLFRSLEMLVWRRAAQLVPVWNIRHSAIADMLCERYGLGSKHIIQNFHKVFALYFSGQWVQGKEMWRDWQPKEHKGEKFDRGVRDQQIYLDGQSSRLLHHAPRIANARRMRELPYHMCWMSGRTTAVDPIKRTLANRPPSAWADRSDFDRQGQIWFQSYMCSLEVIQAACEASLTFELAADFLLARKIFPYSNPILEFQKLLADKTEVLAEFPSLTFQCALNVAGSGQTSVNAVASETLSRLVQGDDSNSNLPPCWLVNTNKDEMMDPLAAKFMGHFGAVFCVTISNRDDIVLTAGADCSLRLFDATSANELRRMDSHQEAVRRCSFSPDNTQILSVSSDNTAILWDLLEGNVVMRLDGHEGEVMDGIFLNGMTVVTASNDCTLQSWDLRTGKVLKQFVGHESAVTACLAMSKGTQIISGSYDKTIRIWDAKTAEQLLLMSGHRGVIYGMSLSTDEKRLVTCSAEEVVTVWDLDLGEELETLHLHNGAILCCALDQSGQWVVTGSSDHTLRLYDLTSQGEGGAVVVGRHEKAICAVTFTHDGQFIISAGADGVVSKWEWEVAHQVATDETPDHDCAISHIELSSDGMFCISLSTDGAAILRILDWEANALGTHQLTDSEEPAVACRFSPYGTSVATLHSFGTLLWDCRTGALIGRFAQQFDLMSLEFPEEVDYGVAPPLSPIVPPRIALQEESAEGTEQGNESETGGEENDQKPHEIDAPEVDAVLQDEGSRGVAHAVVEAFDALVAKDAEPKVGLKEAEHQTEAANRPGSRGSGVGKKQFQAEFDDALSSEDEHAIRPFSSGVLDRSAVQGELNQSRTHSQSSQSSQSSHQDGVFEVQDKAAIRSLEPPPSVGPGRDLIEIGTSEMTMGSNLGMENDPDDLESAAADERQPGDDPPDAPSDSDGPGESNDAVMSEEIAVREGVQILTVSTPPHGLEGGRQVSADDPSTQVLQILDEEGEWDAESNENGISAQEEGDEDANAGAGDQGSGAQVDGQTPLWQFSVLLAELDGKYEPGEHSPDESPVAAVLPASAEEEGKSSQRDSSQADEEKAPPEAYDSDRPEYPVDMETVQRILHTLDKLDATTDPKSALFGQAATVLNQLAGNKLSRRNIAIPARGIPSLNFLVLESIIPYLRHPEEATVLAAIEAVSKLTKPGHKEVMAELERLFKTHMSQTVKTSAVSAVAAIAVSEDTDEEEEMRNRDIRKALTVTVVGAKGIIAADASGTSDPFAMIQLEAYDEAREEFNAFRSQDVSKHRNMEAGPARKVFQTSPELLTMSLKMSLMRKARILELLSEEELKEVLPHCNFVSINKENLLTFQGDPNPSMFLVLNGLMRVMVKFDLGKVKNKDRSRGRRASLSVLRRAKADKNFRKKGTLKGLLDYDFGQQIALLGKGDTIGELSLALQDEFPATVIANQDTILLQFTQDTFKFLKTLRPDVCEDVQEQAMQALNITKTEAPKHVKKTDVKRKTLNPIWNETFLFHNIDVDSTLIITLYDHDIVGSHDFLGQIRIDIMSLHLNQDFEGMVRLEPRIAEEVSGDLQIKLRLETDKRPRIKLESGDTLVSAVKSNTLEIQKDVAAGEGDQTPLTLFRLAHEITSWNVSPADPRIIALGDKEGRVHILRVQDPDNYKSEEDRRQRSRLRAQERHAPAVQAASAS